jgi:hypothetical protein
MDKNIQRSDDPGRNPDPFIENYANVRIHIESRLLTLYNKIYTYSGLFLTE